MDSIRVKTVDPGTKFDRPYDLHDGLTCIIQPAFHLTEADYFVLKGNPGRLSTWGQGLLSGGLAILLSIATEWFVSKAANQPFKKTISDVVLFLITAGLGVLLCLLGLLNNDRRSLMKKIAEHFKHYRPTFGTVSRDDR